MTTETTSSGDAEDRDSRFERERGASTFRADRGGSGYTGDRGPSYSGGEGVVQQTSVVSPRDRVRWGPVFAGLVTALSVFLLLSLLALGLGIVAAQSADPTQTSNAGTVGAIVAAVIGLASFVLGGFVAGRTSAVVGRGSGALNGFLVWALGVVLILALGALGLSQLFGAAGSIFGQLQSSGVSPSDVNVDPNQAADALRNSAIGGFVSLALPAIAAALGGMLGARKEEDVTDLATGR
jgi:hypothetical protein